MMRTLSRFVGGDIVSRVQCDKCKEVSDITVVAAFLKRDAMGEVMAGEYERVQDHSKACFKEMHTCPTTQA